MLKTKIPNLALYLVFIANTVYAVLDGFSWLYWVTAALTACSLVLDIWKAVKTHAGN